MFKKIFVTLLVALGLSACNACGGNMPETQTPYTNSKGDPDAEYAQSLMRNTVKFEEKLHVKISDDTDPKFSDEFDATVAGSGVVIARDKDSALSAIATAWHVCDRYPVGYKESILWFHLEVVSDVQRVLTVDGQQLEIIDVLYQDKPTDVCVVEVAKHFDSEADIADEMPPIGAFVQVVGAPEGTWGKYNVAMQDGRYFGTMDIDVPLGRTADEKPTRLIDFGYYGFAGVGGYSGSGVYYKGKLIGLHTAGSNGYEHASFGPTILDLKRALKRAGYDD
jgi:hypothetical protein